MSHAITASVVAASPVGTVPVAVHIGAGEVAGTLVEDFVVDTDVAGHLLDRFPAAVGLLF